MIVELLLILGGAVVVAVLVDAWRFRRLLPVPAGWSARDVLDTYAEIQAL